MITGEAWPIPSPSLLFDPSTEEIPPPLQPERGQTHTQGSIPFSMARFPTLGMPTQTHTDRGSLIAAEV